MNNFFQDIELWWPNGHGAQKLYVVDIVYHDTSGEMSQRTARVGFRTVELVQEKITGSPGIIILYLLRYNYVIILFDQQCYIIFNKFYIHSNKYIANLANVLHLYPFSSLVTFVHEMSYIEGVC